VSHLLPSTTLRPAPWWHRRLRQARSSPQRRRLVAGRACFRTRLRALRPATEKSPKLGRRLGLLDQRLEPGLGGANCHGERDQGEGDEERHRLSLQPSVLNDSAMEELRFNEKGYVPLLPWAQTP